VIRLHVERLFEIIFEDSDLLVINKPAGLVCHPTKGDQYSSLIGRVRLYLGLAPDAASHIVNRLDRETSGVIMVAKHSGAAGELGKIWESRSVEKEYVAIVHGSVSSAHGLIEAPLGPDEKSIIAVKDRVRPDGAAAQTEFWTERHLERDGPFSVLRVMPRTGRKHQIRIHLAHIGHPIVGDKLYGGDEDCYLALAQDRLTDEHRKKLILPFQALHASSVAFTWRNERKTFRAPPEKFVTDFCGPRPATDF
jgi:23S rRNA pseudouridine1911/1915/1917 synthase